MRQLAPLSEIQRSEPAVSGVKWYEPVLIKWAVGGIEVTQISPRRTHSNLRDDRPIVLKLRNV